MLRLALSLVTIARRSLIGVVVVMAVVPALASAAVVLPVAPIPRFHTVLATVRSGRSVALFVKSFEVLGTGRLGVAISCGGCATGHSNPHSSVPVAGAHLVTAPGWKLTNGRTIVVLVYGASVVGRYLTLAASRGNRPRLVYGVSGCLTATGHRTACPTGTRVPGRSAVVPSSSAARHAEFVLLALSAGDGSGYVSGAGLDCDPACAGSYADGSLETVLAVAQAGSTFIGWAGACSGTGPCLLRVGTDQTVVAIFIRDPTTAILSGPAGQSTDDPATFTYSSDQRDATFQCRLDGGPWISCPATGISYSNPTPGQHSFQVRADHLGAFDPSPPLRLWTQVAWLGIAQPLPGAMPRAITCVSATRCTVVDNAGNEDTFSPVAVSNGHVINVDGWGLNSVACPSATECVAVDGNGGEVTFDPSTGLLAGTTLVPGNVNTTVSAVSCPSTSQCTAVSGYGNAYTFDPLHPAAFSTVTLEATGMFYTVSCPSVSQCTAADTQGGEVTWDPTGIIVPPRVPLSMNTVFYSVVCPTTTACVAVADNGVLASFDPANTGAAFVQNVDASGLQAASCPIASQCTAVDASGSAITFDPATPQNTAKKSVVTGRLTAVSCPTIDRCMALEVSGGPFSQTSNEIAFVPQ